MPCRTLQLSAGQVIPHGSIMIPSANLLPGLVISSSSEPADVGQSEAPILDQPNC